MLGYEIDDEDDSAVYRQWGHYKVLHRGDGFTVKQLTILPGKSLSDQRHFKRSEQWLIVKGVLNIDIEYSGMPGVREEWQLNSSVDGSTIPSNFYTIPVRTWHRPYNAGTENVVVIEVWLGDSTEEDIERRNV
jgi:mannose-6-phosphate isomerase-like protein (cupin superfamily)